MDTSMLTQKTWTRFWVFYLLTFLLLALLPILSGVFGDGSMDFDGMGARASAETGIPWTSNIVSVVRLALVEPGLWLYVLGSSIPALAALVMLTIGFDSSAWSDFFRRFHPLGRGKVEMKDVLAVYLGLSIALIVILLIVFEIRGVLSPERYVRSVGLFGAALVPALLASAFLDQGAILEEAGWRGFASPLLKDILGNPLYAAVVIGIAWGFWHIPRDVVTGVIERLGMMQYLLLYLPSFTLGTIGVSIIAMWAMDRVGGSLWPAIVVHGIANDAMGFSGKVTIVEALTPYSQITRALPMAILAALLIAVWGWKDDRTHG